MSKVDTILEEIKGLSLLEAAELVKKMEETFGVSAAAAAPVMMAGAAGGGAAAAPAEEKTEFSVVLTEVGANKINVISLAGDSSSLHPYGRQNLCGRNNGSGSSIHCGARRQGRSASRGAPRNPTDLQGMGWV